MTNVDKATAEGVEINLGGKSRRLKLDMWALAQVEKRTGKSALNGDIWKNITASDVVVLTHEGLKLFEPDLAEEQVGRMIDLGNFNYVCEKIRDAVTQSTGASDKKNA